MNQHYNSPGEAENRLAAKLEEGLFELVAADALEEVYGPKREVAYFWDRNEISLESFLAGKTSIQQINTDSFQTPCDPNHCHAPRLTILTDPEKVILANWLVEVACHSNVTFTEAFAIVDTVSYFLGTESAALAPILVSWLDGDLVRSKENILFALSKIKDNSSYNKIAEFIKSPNQSLSAAALYALGQFDTEVSSAAITSCVNVLSEWIDLQSATADIQLDAAAFLLIKAGRRGEEATEALVTIIHSLLPDRQFATSKPEEFGKFQKDHYEGTHAQCGACLPEITSRKKYRVLFDTWWNIFYNHNQTSYIVLLSLFKRDSSS